LVAGGAAGFETDEKGVVIELELAGQNKSGLQDGETFVGGHVEAQGACIAHLAREHVAFEF
jgi:hypothetical protein